MQNRSGSETADPRLSNCLEVRALEKLQLSPDRKALSLQLQAELSATELEALIAELALCRGQMDPPVSLEPPSAKNPDPIHVSNQDDPIFQLRRLRDGRIRVWLRNHGLGWMVFNIPILQACTMRDYLVANTPADQTPSDFFDESFEEGHRSH